MSQFRILIDEREEAKRNFEQLKAEIDLINSGLGEPSKSALNSQSEPPAVNVAETSELQFASTPAYEVELAAYNSQNVPSCLPDQILPADPTSETKAAYEPNPKPARINQFTGEPQDRSTKRIPMDMLLRCVVDFLCWPCYYCFCPAPPTQYLAPVGLEFDAKDDQSAPYPYGPVDYAYENLETSGPEGVFELAVQASDGHAPPSLPPPAELESYYHS